MNEINLSLFGERLKEGRKSLGLSQSDAADLVGVTREHWGRCERGLGMPGGEVLAALANAGADVRYILTGKRDFAPPPRLSSEEETMLGYFKEASPAARRAALRELLSVTPAASSPKRGDVKEKKSEPSVKIGGTHSQHASGAGSIQIGSMETKSTKRRG